MKKSKLKMKKSKIAWRDSGYKYELEDNSKVSLKKCPYCGGKPKIATSSSRDGYGNKTDTFRVECKCKMVTPWFDSAIRTETDGTIMVFKNGAVDAAEYWNRRVEDGTSVLTHRDKE